MSDEEYKDFDIEDFPELKDLQDYDPPVTVAETMQVLSLYKLSAIEDYNYAYLCLEDEPVEVAKRLAELTYLGIRLIATLEEAMKRESGTDD